MARKKTTKTTGKKTVDARRARIRDIAPRKGDVKGGGFGGGFNTGGLQGAKTTS